MNRRDLAGLTLLSATLSFHAAAQVPDGTYLAPGVGVGNILRIGDRRPPAGVWERDARLKALEYRTTPEGVVVVIRCDAPQCVTAQAIRVGSSESDMLRRYGSPKSETRTAEGMYYEYVGVGFEIAGGTVRRLYAFPIARK